MVVSASLTSTIDAIARTGSLGAIARAEAAAAALRLVRRVGRSAALGLEKPIRSCDDGVCLLTFRFWGDGAGPGKGV
jgi:hypothetical protein